MKFAGGSIFDEPGVNIGVDLFEIVKIRENGLRIDKVAVYFVEIAGAKKGMDTGIRVYLAYKLQGCMVTSWSTSGDADAVAACIDTAVGLLAEPHTEVAYP